MADTCGCDNEDGILECCLYRWRGDPEWWLCAQCDGRVSPLTEAERVRVRPCAEKSLSGEE